MAHFHDNALVGASGQGGYQISRSLRFNSADSAYLNRGMSAGSGRKQFTISFWTKISKFGTNRAFVEAYFNATNFLVFGLINSDKILNYSIQGGTDYGYVYTPDYRDPSAWYHFMTAWDTDNATATQRIRTYVNGVEITAKTADYGDPPSGYVTDFLNSGFTHSIGRRIDTGVYYDGLMTEFYVIDGQALTPSSFGETDTITGVWKPKKYAGTYGTNGFYLNFSDNSGTTSTTLGKDSSGNSNNWTPNNFSVTAGAGNDSMIDTPTPYADGGNGRGNYCTGNPLYTPSSNSRMSLTNGNLEWGQAAINANSSMAGTFEMRSGKWYWEVTVGGSFNYSSLGIQTTTNTAWRGGGTVLYRSDGQKVIGGTNSAYGSSFTTNDVIGFAYDADAGSLTCYKNNTSQGVIYSSGTGNIWVPCAHDDNAGSGVTYYHQCNFGQRAFAYTPPSGFVALNTQNLPEPSIKKPSIYFDATTYTGNGATPQNIVNASGFQPDLVWTKSRSNAVDHFLADSVRGANNILRSNLADAEAVGTGGISAFNSNGFSVNGNQNTNTYTYVGWQWKESATPGFDIVTYTGTGSNQTISHSLGVTPAMYITKRRNAANSWVVYHQSLGNNILVLESTSAVIANSAFFSSYPNSSSFYPSTDATINASGGTYVTYLWSEVAGFSKFGSYSGTGSADGPFVFCNFRPRWVMVKRTDSTGDWWMWDSARNTYNVVNNQLYANSSTSEAVDSWADLLSNGFKIRNTYGANNASGGTYVYAAFSESPFKYSLAR